MEGLLNYNRSYEKGKNYNTAENCLLHIGNLDAIWELGKKFDATLSIDYLVAIQNRLKLDDHGQALVIW